MNSKELIIILERNGQEWDARLELPNYLIATQGENINEVTGNIRMLLEDYVQHEGSEDALFKNVNIQDLKFEYAYELIEFFEQFDAIKIGKVAELAGINASLVRQYANGIKQASEKQVRKIEEAVHKLGKELMDVHLV